MRNIKNVSETVGSVVLLGCFAVVDKLRDGILLWFQPRKDHSKVARTEPKEDGRSREKKLTAEFLESKLSMPEYIPYLKSRCEAEGVNIYGEKMHRPLRWGQTNEELRESIQKFLEGETEK